MDRFPIRKIRNKWAAIMASVGGMTGALVTGGLLSTEQGAAVATAFTATDVTVSAVAALITAGSVLVATFTTASESQDVVTPVADPRGNDGTPLVPASGRHA